MRNFAADVCDGNCGGFDEQMTFLQILGLILMLLPIVALLTFEFIADWKATLFALVCTLVMMGMILLGAFLVRG